MEYTQWVGTLTVKILQWGCVLILVVMEYTQWVGDDNKEYEVKLSLNPCCNGIYSMSVWQSIYIRAGTVLILVVMEYTQWVVHKANKTGER